MALAESDIRSILADSCLGDVASIEKIEIGFSNDVYSVDERYILKVSQDDGRYLLRDIYLCNLLKDRVPAPRIIHWGRLPNRVFMIYHRISGRNLYSRWHLLSITQRRELVRQLCEMLRTINQTPYEGFVRKFGVDTSQSWRDRKLRRIDELLHEASAKGLLPDDVAHRTREFVHENVEALREEKMALTNWDPHFDNVIVSEDDSRIAGMLDFEMTDVSSIDFVLDIVGRMVRQPGKYASEESEPFTCMEDYSELIDWYREFYPEVFDFPHLDKRLAIYCIEHSLGEMVCYPEGTAAREELLRCIG